MNESRMKQFSSHGFMIIIASWSGTWRSPPHHASPATAMSLDTMGLATTAVSLTATCAFLHF